MLVKCQLCCFFLAQAVTKLALAANYLVIMQLGVYFAAAIQPDKQLYIYKNAIAGYVHTAGLLK